MQYKIYLSVLFFYFGLCQTHSQEYFSFYNLSDYVIQTQNISPVYIPKNKFTFAVPVLNMGYNANSGFKINELLVKNELTNKLEVDFEKLFNSSEETNNINIDASINLFYMAFKRKRGSISFFANTIGTNNWKYTKDFLGLVVNGVEESFILKEENNGNGYNEIGIGFTQTFLDDKLAIGLRAKYLNGFLHTSLKENSQVSLEYNKESGEYRIHTQNTIANFSGEQYLRSIENLIQNKKIDSYKFFTNNIGFGLDFGATYKTNDKFTFEIAINDIGYISWKNDVKNYSIEDTPEQGVLYDGLNLNHLEDELTANPDDNILDIIQSILTEEFSELPKPKQTENSFKSRLSMKTYLSVKYKLTPKNTFTLASFNTHAFEEFKPSYSLGYNRTLQNSTFGLSTSLAGVDNQFLFGANFAIALGPVQFYAATDSLKAIFMNAEESTGANVRFGINLIFGNASSEIGE